MAGHAGNTACARGADDEFGKGGNAYDRYYGDPDQVRNPSLGPLDEPAITAYRFSPARSQQRPAGHRSRRLVPARAPR